MVRGAAEEAKPGGFEGIVGLPDGGALVDVLRVAGELEAARLEDADREALLSEPPRERDAGGTRADDADIEDPVAEPVVAPLFGVEDHETAKA